MLAALRIPVGWADLFKRTAREFIVDNCLSLAAQLAYYFFLALFPALLFFVAVASFFPVHDLVNTIVGMLAGFAPREVITIVTDQLTKIATGQNGGILTFGMLATIWSTTSGMLAIIDTLNAAYDITESRPWWKVRLLAIGLTIAIALFILTSFTLVVAGPQLGEYVAHKLHIDQVWVWVWTWWVLQWPLVFALTVTALAMIYYYAPDAEQDWVWITPGSITATILWLLASLLFRYYVVNFTNYTATYGVIGGVMVLLLWFYISGLAVLFGAELNAEIEHASPYGKEPGERVPGEKKAIGARAARLYEERQKGVVTRPLVPLSATLNCDIDRPLPRPVYTPVTPRFSDWVLSGTALSAVLAPLVVALRSRFKKVSD